MSIEPLDATRDEFLERLSFHCKDAFAVRRELHGIAELGHEETKTASLVASAIGSSVRLGPETTVLAETGVRGPRVAVRAELDALPVDEETGVSWACGDGRMHACGHDIHMAAALALWRAAVDLGEDLPFRLLLVFQPAEECYPSGAKLLVEEGLLADVDAVVAAHVHPEIDAGQVALDGGPVNAACANFAMAIEGRPGHVAYPDQAVDPVPTLASLLGQLTQLGGKCADGIVGIGVVESGDSENVIPGSAIVRGTVRGRSDNARAELISALTRVARDASEIQGCPVVLNVEEGEPALVNDEAITAAARSLLASSGMGLAAPWRSFGADDFAYYGVDLPVAMAFVGLRGMEGFSERSLHHPQFLPPDEAIERIATTLACLVYAAAWRVAR